MEMAIPVSYFSLKAYEISKDNQSGKRDHRCDLYLGLGKFIQ